MPDTDTPAAKKAPAKKAPAKSGGGVGTTLAKGGGPENPAADAAALAKLKQQRAERADVRAERREARASHAYAQRQQDRQARTGGGGKVSAPKAGGGAKKIASFAWSGNRKLLTAQYLLCIVVLFLGTVTAPPGSKDDVHRAMVKGSALSGLFMLLALVSSGGKGAAKAATALGTLISASYLFTSSDVHNLTAFVSGFFGKGGPAWQTASDAAAAAAGDLGVADTTGATAVGEGIGAVAGQIGEELGGAPTGQKQTSSGTNEGYVAADGSYTSTTGFGY